MPREVDRHQVRQLMRDGAQVVEVLPKEEFEADHLPGAISLPLRRLETEARATLDPVRYARPAPDGIALTLEATPRPAGLTPAWTWAALMRRVFALDVLACPRCGGRLRVIATVQDPAVVRAILAHLGLAPGPDSPGPAPPQPNHTAATG
jgi:rhodanese-related sulfurtransferase